MAPWRWRIGASARRLGVALLALSLLLPLGPTARPALAGDDVCPEPNHEAAAACAPPPVAQRAYAPPPASQYTLQLADLGPGYSEVARVDENDGHSLMLAFQAEDARLMGDPFGEHFLINSRSRVSLVWSLVFIADYGQDEEVGQLADALLNEWRTDYNVEPAIGWGSEQVFSFTVAGQGQYLRGILLRHRNVLSAVRTRGFGHLATWDHISGLMRLTEQRIMAITE